MTTKYRIKLIKYEEQYEDCIITRETRGEIIDLAHKLVYSISKGELSLMNELNRMQCEAGGLNMAEENVFKNKYEIPFYFINLLLKDYGIEIGVIKEFKNE